jgi:hypothetical protein
MPCLSRQLPGLRCGDRQPLQSPSSCAPRSSRLICRTPCPLCQPGRGARAAVGLLLPRQRAGDLQRTDLRPAGGQQVRVPPALGPAEAARGGCSWADGWIRSCAAARLGRTPARKQGGGCSTPASCQACSTFCSMLCCTGTPLPRRSWTSRRGRRGCLWRGSLCGRWPACARCCRCGPGRKGLPCSAPGGCEGSCSDVGAGARRPFTPATRRPLACLLPCCPGCRWWRRARPTAPPSPPT